MAVVIIVAGAVLIYPNLNPITPTPTPTPTPETTVQEQVRDAAIAYIQTNHTEAAQFLTDLSWSGGRATAEGLLGAETYIYTSGGWNVTIKYPVIPNPVYTINATYTSGNTAIDWQGTYENDVITETSYTYTP